MLLVLASLLLTCFVGCGDDGVPKIVKDTDGGKKWQNAIDYTDPDNWLSLPTEATKDVDVLYFYPESYVDDGDSSVSDIDDPVMRAGAAVAFERQAGVFAETCNVFAPYYRQVDGDYLLSLSAAESDELIRYAASCDAAAALDYYFEHLNGGRPFILAGHSQGSQTVAMLLSDYMKAHPDYYAQMVAAYVIGFSVTETYLRENSHLEFATGAFDTGVIISYNTEGSANRNYYNAYLRTGALSINPLNWRLDDTYAGTVKNLGSLDATGATVEGFADAQLDTARGVVVTRTVNAALYAEENTQKFGPECYHGYDYSFFYENLKKNVLDRVHAYMGITLYGLWVGDTQVYNKGAEDVLGDGTVRYVGDEDGGTLYLTDLTLATLYTADNGTTAGIYSTLDHLTISVSGTNRIGFGTTAPLTGILAKSLTVTGDGTLISIGSTRAMEAQSLTLSSGTLSLSCVAGEGATTNHGLLTGTLHISGGTLNASSGMLLGEDGCGILVNGDATLTGGTVNAGVLSQITTSVGMKIAGDLTVSDGVLNVFGMEDALVLNTLTLTGGEVVAESMDSASDGVISADGAIMVGGGALTVKLYVKRSSKVPLLPTELLTFADGFTPAVTAGTSLSDATPIDDPATYAYKDAYIRITQAE